MPLSNYVRAATAPPCEYGTVPNEIAAKPPNAFVDRASIDRASVDLASVEIVGNLTMLRIAASEAFEGAARRAIVDLARDVLARELAVAPVDLEALVERAVAAFAASEPVALGVAREDLERVRSALPLRPDAALRSGDLVVYVRDGAFESTLEFRFDAVLERALRAGAP